MPRLRYLKNGNPNYENPPDLSINYDESEDEGFIEQNQPRKGWWSSGAVLAAISTDKIRQVLQNYKQNIIILEQELLSRADAVRHEDARYGNLLNRTCEIRHAGMRSRKADKLQSPSKFLKGIRLSREQREKILKEWLVLIESYKQTKGE